MRKIVIGVLLLLSVGASAQWQQTGSKVRYVNGLGIPTKDTAAGVSADSSQILIRPADSSLYVKYKRTWLRVGGGGGSIAGSGTTNYIPKFTSSTAIGNSQIFDNGTNVGINATAPNYKLTIDGGSNNFLGILSSGIGTPGTLLGTYYGFTGNTYQKGATWFESQDINGRGKFHIALNSAANSSNVTTSDIRMTVDYGGNVGIGTTSPGSILEIAQATPIFTLNATSTSLHGIEWKNSGTLDAFIKQQPSTGEMRFSNGRNGSWGGFMTFYTDVSERMRITSAGNVGIGTASPSQKLHVLGDALISNPSNAFLKVNSTSGIAVLELTNGAGTQLIYGGAGGSNNLDFYTNSIFRMRISANGNALINTNTDNGVDKLQVSGSMNVSTLATTNNLSVTTNATVGGDVQITGLIGVGTTPQTYAIKLARSGNNIVEFGTQSATNSSRFVHSSSTAFGVIGNASGAGISGGSNGDFAIGTPSGSNNIIFHINAVERVRVKTDGEVLVFSSTDNGAYNLQCNGTGVWGAGAYVNGSDSALKYEIKDINNALHLVMQLKPKTYKYKPFYNNSNEIQTGFIAQDLEKVLKNEIYKDGVVISGGKYKGVAYDALIPLLVKTIQEQQSQIEDIKKQIEELKKLIK